MKDTITLLQNSVNQTEQDSLHLAKYRKLLTSQSPQTLLEDQAFQDQNQSKLLLGRKIKFLIDTPEKVNVYPLIVSRFGLQPKNINSYMQWNYIFVQILCIRNSLKLKTPKPNDSL